MCCRAFPEGMAKNKGDVILRDRLQFDVDANGNVDTLYGRVDLSDYVSIPKSEGIKIKEIRYQLREPGLNRTGAFRAQWTALAAPFFGSIKIAATTTAYETLADVGIGSPNVISCFEWNQVLDADAYLVNTVQEYSTPHLHPEGFPVVTDVLIGVAVENAGLVANQTIELDIMVIAEPVKLTKDDMENMLTQATDL